MPTIEHRREGPRLVSSRGPHVRAAAAAGAVAALLAALAMAAPASATTYTWTAGSTSDGNFSDGANWGGAAPASASTTTLNLPLLNAANCPASGASNPGCFETYDDKALTVGGLSLDLSLGNLQTFGGTGPLTIDNGITGSITTGQGSGGAPVQLGMPIRLGAAQTWSITGGEIDVGGGLASRRTR